MVGNVSDGQEEEYRALKIVIDVSMKRTATRLVSILGQDVDVVGEYKYPGIYIDNNKKKGRMRRLCFLRKLRFFDVCSKMMNPEPYTLPDRSGAHSPNNNKNASSFQLLWQNLFQKVFSHSFIKETVLELLLAHANVSSAFSIKQSFIIICFCCINIASMSVSPC